jgi:hypothetical protein
VRQLLAEAVELRLGDAALEERARVHAGRRVALEEDRVAAAGVVLAAEEVVEARPRTGSPPTGRWRCGRRRRSPAGWRG